eukprot:g7426.t1
MKAFSPRPASHAPMGMTASQFPMGVQQGVPRTSLQMPKMSYPHATSPPVQNRGLPRTHQDVHADVRYRSSPSVPIVQQQSSTAKARHSSAEAIKGCGKGYEQRSYGSVELSNRVNKEVPRHREQSVPLSQGENSVSRGPSLHVRGQGQPPTEARLQYLESELASFTSKIGEMRTHLHGTETAALQEEVQNVRPSLDGTGKAPSSVTTSMGNPHQSGQSGSDDVESDTSGWVLDALKKNGCSLCKCGRLEAEARKQLNVKIEAMFLEEKKKRDEAIRQMQAQRDEQATRLDQRWQNHLKELKEELSLHRAVESDLEARLRALQRDVEVQAGNAANQAEKVTENFLQMRESTQQELNAQNLEISNASAALSRLIDDVRAHDTGIKADMAPSTEITENLVRAEVRRQLAERPPDGKNLASRLELQALSSRLERLEQELGNEATSRQEERGQSISMLHELVGELGKTQMQALQQLEDAVKTKLDAALSEAHAAQQAATEEQQLRRQQLSKETKDREETCMMILKSMEEKISNESKHLQMLLGEQRLQLEQQIRGHDKELQSSLEITVTNFVEKHSKDVVSARHDVLELREELQEALRNKRFDPLSADELQRLVDGQSKLWATLDQVRHDLGEQLQQKDHSHRRSLGGGLSSLDIEELRTQLVSERLAREQGDDRCMENIRDLEEQKRSRELQALERRLSNTEDRHNDSKSFFAGDRPATTSACPQSGAPRTILQSSPWPKPPSFSAAFHGEQDGLPGVLVDRFGSSAVVTFQLLGSATMELIELTRWIGKLQQLTVHHMTAKKEKWAQEGSEFTTNITRGTSSRVCVEEANARFDIDVLQGVIPGQWNYSLEALRAPLAQRLGSSGTVLDAWAQCGQWGLRCAQSGAADVVLLEEQLGLAKLCRENAAKNGVEEKVTVLHRSDVHGELQNMAESGIRFDCVSLNVRVRFERYLKHQRGQFGRWYKPSLKGYERAIALGDPWLKGERSFRWGRLGSWKFDQSHRDVSLW